MGALSAAGMVVRSTLAAAVGQSGSLFPATGRLQHGLVRFDDDAEFPGGAELMSRGRHHELLVRTAQISDGLTSVCLKFPDLYGPGRDQDFLLMSSGDGAPLHHVPLPSPSEGASLYSSLWLYLAGFSPLLFGVRADASSHRSSGGAVFTEGDTLSFLVSPPIGAFRQVGEITMGEDVADDKHIDFAGRNCGGNLRALPPVRLYRGR